MTARRRLVPSRKKFEHQDDDQQRIDCVVHDVTSPAGRCRSADKQAGGDEQARDLRQAQARHHRLDDADDDGQRQHPPQRTAPSR